MAFPLLKQEFHDIDLELCGLWQRNAIGRRSAGRRFPDPQCCSLAYRDDLRYRRLTVQDSNRFAAADSPQILAQSGFELGDAHLSHGHIMTRNGHLLQGPVSRNLKCYPWTIVAQF
jgi:hypothetical protein